MPLPDIYILLVPADGCSASQQTPLLGCTRVRQRGERSKRRLVVVDAGRTVNNLWNVGDNVNTVRWNRLLAARPGYFSHHTVFVIKCQLTRATVFVGCPAKFTFIDTQAGASQRWRHVTFAIVHDIMNTALTRPNFRSKAWWSAFCLPTAHAIACCLPQLYTQFATRRLDHLCRLDVVARSTARMLARAMINHAT